MIARQHQRFADATFAIACVFLAACAALTPPEPTTPIEAAAVVYSSIEGTARATRERLAAGAITPDQAGDILGILDRALEVTDIAKAALAAGRTDDADAYLDIATEILNSIEARLRQ